LLNCDSWRSGGVLAQLRTWPWKAAPWTTISVLLAATGLLSYFSDYSFSSTFICQ